MPPEASVCCPPLGTVAGGSIPGKKFQEFIASGHSGLGSMARNRQRSCRAGQPDAIVRFTVPECRQRTIEGVAGSGRIQGFNPEPALLVKPAVSVRKPGPFGPVGHDDASGHGT